MTIQSSREDTREEAIRELVKREYYRKDAQEHLGSFCKQVDEHYVTARHIRYLCENLEALERGDIDRLIVQMPPRHSKSLHVSERFPAWFLGKRKRTRIILAGNSAELAEGSSRKIRGILEDERYPFDGVTVDPNSRAVNRWHSTAGGEVIAVGVGSSLTGRGADLLSIDDPVRDRQEIESVTQRDHQWDWYTDVARTRLMPGGVQLLTMTRWHDDDLVGRILNSPDAKKWRIVSFPALAIEGDLLGRQPGEALWPEWFDEEYLLETKAVSGPRSWASIYQQNPIPADGSIFRETWFQRRYKDVPQRFIDQRTIIGTLNQRKTQMVVIQSIDSAWKTGKSNDWSVIATWGITETDYYLLDIWRKRVEYPDLIRAAGEQANIWKPNAIYIEEAQSGQALVQHFRANTRLPVIGVRPVGTKEARADMVTPIFEAQKVLLPEAQNAPWLEEWISEHLRFPAGTYDDQVDTTSLALMNQSFRSAGRRTSNQQIARALSGWMQR